MWKQKFIQENDKFKLYSNIDKTATDEKSEPWKMTEKYYTYRFNLCNPLEIV